MTLIVLMEEGAMSIFAVSFFALPLHNLFLQIISRILWFQITVFDRNVSFCSKVHDPTKPSLRTGWYDEFVKFN